MEGAGDFERDARDFWENVSENARDFLGMGGLILICTGDVDAMVCLVVMLAP